MITTKHAPLAAFVLVAVNISICTGFSSPIISQSTRCHDAIFSQRRPRRCSGLFDDSSVPNNTPRIRWKDDNRRCHTKSTTSLPMGVFDFLQEKFLDSREGEFIPLKKSDGDTFGPGPLILMYAVPETMDDHELKDMVEDGMPGRVKEGVVIRRLSKMDENGEGSDELLDSSVGEALNKAMDVKASSVAPLPIPPPKNMVGSPEEDTPCPVLYFSGVSNSEMMDTFDIIANEIYEETNRVHWPACAKVVPPALKKSMRQVLTEISGDHADAMRMRNEAAEKTDEI